MHNEVSLNIITLNISQILCRGRYNSCMMEVRSVSDILVVGSEGKRLLWIQTNKEGTDRQNEA